MLSHLFTTPVWHRRIHPAASELAELREYLLGLREEIPGEHLSNAGGWHSPGNLFVGETHRQFPFLNQAIREAVFAYLNAAFQFEGRIAFTLTGWAVVNGPGHSNLPHNHPQSLLSGVFYVAVPEPMSGGQIVFMDPRFNVNAFGTETMRGFGLRPSWDATTVSHEPAVGDLLLFPSWLMHYVNAFESSREDALRIVISFNVVV